jgi:Ni/Co efflux regulator RcnB
MKRSLSILCATAVALTSLSSFAQDRDHDHRGAPDRHDERHDPRPPAPRPGEHHRDDHRPMPIAERGAGPNHDFRRGGRLPVAYRHHQYVVDNWRAHHLSAPPRGYHWVQTGSDYVLVAIATGIIAQVLLSQ